MPSILVLAPDPAEAEGLLQGFMRRNIDYEHIQVGVLDCVQLPSLDMLLGVGGNGKAQFGIHAQYLMDRCGGTDVLACVGAAGRLADNIQIGDIVLGTVTIEYDYKERFNPEPPPRHDGSADVVDEFLGLSQSTPFPFRVHPGVIASGDEDVVDPVRAAELRAATGGLCVAWEGSGGARAARLNGVKFIEIRGITDVADGEAARCFHDRVGAVMLNVVDLLVGWSTTRTRGSSTVL
jgi:adenosylhomocysteine nucleosidase